MSGKGSKQRPMTVQQELFEDNWDRVFDKKDNMLREVVNDGKWSHSCTVDMSVVWIGKDETCDYCGSWEEDGQ